MTPAARIVVVGAGGNIGSHLVPHLGRMAGVREVVLVDQGKYEASNLRTQDITPREVGHGKAVVQARRLRRINPALTVRPLAVPVEDVPLGSLKADVLLACLDSRAARQFVNQAAWQMGTAWIDAGVHADGLLAQVTAYLPGPDNPCLECAWDERDYAALEQTYPCGADPVDPPATGGPSSLGALAAALQALECRKLLSGATDRVAFGRQVLVDASSHKHYVTALGRNLECRMHEHRPWRIQSFPHRPAQATVAQLFALRPGPYEADGPLTLSVAGRRFVTKLTCTACRCSRRQLRFDSRRAIAPDRCAECGATMVAAGFDLQDRLELRERSDALGSRSLRALGLRDGDVFTVGQAAGRLHFLVDGESAAAGSSTRSAGI